MGLGSLVKKMDCRW